MIFVQVLGAIEIMEYEYAMAWRNFVKGKS